MHRTPRQNPDTARAVALAAARETRPGADGTLTGVGNALRVVTDTFRASGTPDAPATDLPILSAGYRAGTLHLSFDAQTAMRFVTAVGMNTVPHTAHHAEMHEWGGTVADVPVVVLGYGRLGRIDELVDAVFGTASESPVHVRVGVAAFGTDSVRVVASDSVHVTGTASATGGAA